VRCLKKVADESRAISAREEAGGVHAGRPKQAGNLTVRKRDDSCPMEMDSDTSDRNRERRCDVARDDTCGRDYSRRSDRVTRGGGRLSKPARRIEHAIFPWEMRKRILLSRPLRSQCSPFCRCLCLWNATGFQSIDRGELGRPIAARRFDPSDKADLTETPRHCLQVYKHASEQEMDEESASEKAASRERLFQRLGKVAIFIRLVASFKFASLRMPLCRD